MHRVQVSTVTSGLSGVSGLGVSTISHYTFYKNLLFTTRPGGGDADFDDVMADPEFLKQVLTDLPGVDPSSEAVKSVMGNIQKGNIEIF